MPPSASCLGQHDEGSRCARSPNPERRQGHPWTLRHIPDGKVAITVRIAPLPGIQENHEYPSQLANYLGNPGLYEKSFE